MKLQLSIATRVFLLRDYIENRINICQHVIDTMGDPNLRQVACISDLSLVLGFLDKILPEGRSNGSRSQETREVGTGNDLLN